MQITLWFERLVLWLGDAAILVGGLWLSLVIRYGDVPNGAMWMSHFKPFLLILAVWFVIFFAFGLYDRQTMRVKRELPRTLISAQIINALAAVVFFYTISWFAIAPKTLLLIYVILTTVLLVLWRLFATPRVIRSARVSTAGIGHGQALAELAAECTQNTRQRYNITHICNIEEGGDIGSVIARARAGEFKILIVDLHHPRMADWTPALYECAAHGVTIADLSEVYEELFQRVPLESLRHEWLLRNVSFSEDLAFRIIKRIIDIGVSFVLGIIFLIFLPFVALAIRLDSRGALFINQMRFGRHGKTITVWKLRTMTSNEHDSKTWIGESENRVTCVGSFLRKTSLDEIPQVWNIFIGEMSLIGPRNDIVGLGERLAEEIPFYMARVAVRPGITGWAQVMQQYADGQTSPQGVDETKRRLEYDLYYIRHRSVGLDLIIALRTGKTILKRLIRWA